MVARRNIFFLFINIVLTPVRAMFLSLSVMKKISLLFLLILSALNLLAQDHKLTLLKPDRVFDGLTMHTGWAVLIKDNRIEAAGETNGITIPANTQIIELKGTTLLPGFI